MHKPDIGHYPLWLRELIFPTELMNCRGGQQDHIRFERSLRSVFDNRRKDPICDVVSEVTLENIRYRFRLYEFEQRIVDQRKMIYELTERVVKLERKMRKIKKKDKP